MLGLCGIKAQQHGNSIILVKRLKLDKIKIKKMLVLNNLPIIQFYEVCVISIPI